jgi:hypothetical protein
LGKILGTKKHNYEPKLKRADKASSVVFSKSHSPEISKKWFLRPSRNRQQAVMISSKAEAFKNHLRVVKCSCFSNKGTAGEDNLTLGIK